MRKVKNNMIRGKQKNQEIGIVKKQDISENQVKIAYLALGSNLGNKLINLEKAKLLLNKKIKIVKTSSFYETPSWPNSNFPKFLNIVIKIKTNLKPLALLNLIKSIEKKLGRKKTLKNYPRTCDIDIIDYNGKIINYKNLQIPHPNLHKRNFVLIPLFEISKGWFHPVFKVNIANLISKLGIIKLRSIKQI